MMAVLRGSGEFLFTAQPWPTVDPSRSWTGMSRERRNRSIARILRQSEIPRTDKLRLLSPSEVHLPKATQINRFNQGHCHYTAHFDRDPFYSSLSSLATYGEIMWNHNDLPTWLNQHHFQKLPNLNHDLQWHPVRYPWGHQSIHKVSSRGLLNHSKSPCSALICLYWDQLWTESLWCGFAEFCI